MAEGRYDLAVPLVRRAIELAPAQPYLHAGLADAMTFRHDYWLNPEQCAALAADGTLEEAIRSWKKALETGLVCEWASFSLGHALTAVGRPQEAVPHLRQATDHKIRLVRPDLFGKYETGKVQGPDFLIIGATKCGTTSLYEYLCAHPQVLPAIWKEPEFYRFPERGLDWYLAHLPRIPQGGERYLTGEASSCYLSIWEAPDRVLATFPKTKLIVLMRDPVDKAISHCHHDRKLGCEHRTVDEALNRELDLLEKLDDPFFESEEYWKTEKGYVWLGLYAYMLHHWVARFPKEQLLAIPSEELWGQPERTLTRVFDYLGLPDHKLPGYEVHLQGKYDKTKPEPVRERLQRFFAEHNELLYEQIGHRLDWQHPEPGTAAGRRKRISAQPPWERAKDLAVAASAEAAAGRHDRAVALAQQAVDTAPKLAYLHATLGNTLTRFQAYWGNPALTKQFVDEGVLDRAIGHLRKAVELEPTDEWSSFCLGRALAATGRLEESIACLRRATDHKVRKARPDLFPAYDQAAARGPDFLVLGAHGCGAVPLYERVCAHPQVLPALLPDSDFFRGPELGREWYVAHFPRLPGTGLTSGEASDLYLSTWKTPERIHATFPGVKLVVLLRDPVERAIAHWQAEAADGRDQRDVATALGHELDLLEAREKPLQDSGDYWQTERGYLWHGLYDGMLENVFTKFPREQALVIASEELVSQPAPTLARVLAHLGLSDATPGRSEPWRAPATAGDVPAPLRARLRRFFAAHNERLFTRLDHRFAWQQP